jgi:hypothetical protein
MKFDQGWMPRAELLMGGGAIVVLGPNDLEPRALRRHLM